MNNVLDAGTSRRLRQVDGQARRIDMAGVAAKEVDGSVTDPRQRGAQPCRELVEDRIKRQALAHAEKLEDICNPQVSQHVKYRGSIVMHICHWRHRHKEVDPGRQSLASGEASEGLDGPFRVPNVSNGRAPSDLQHMVDMRRKIISSHLIEREVPECFAVNRQACMVHSPHISTVVAEPHVKACIRQKEAQ